MQFLTLHHLTVVAYGDGRSTLESARVKKWREVDLKLPRYSSHDVVPVDTCAVPVMLESSTAPGRPVVDTPILPWDAETATFPLDMMEANGEYSPPTVTEDPPPTALTLTLDPFISSARTFAKRRVFRKLVNFELTW